MQPLQMPMELIMDHESWPEIHADRANFEQRRQNLRYKQNKLLCNNSEFPASGMSLFDHVNSLEFKTIKILWLGPPFYFQSSIKWWIYSINKMGYK